MSGILIHKEGFLYKKGEVGIKKRWRKRWFVLLEKEQKIVYSKKKKHKEKEKGAIILGPLDPDSIVRVDVNVDPLAPSGFNSFPFPPL